MNELKKLKILYFVKGDVFGGAEKFILELSSIMQNDFGKIFICSVDNNLVKYIDIGNIKAVPVFYKKTTDIWKFIKSFLYINKLIRKEKISILHSQHRIYLPLIKLLKVFNQVTNIYTAVNVFSDNKYKYFKPDYSVAVSTPVFNNLICKHDFDPETTKIIFNGIKQDYCNKIRRSIMKKDKYILGFCGRFVPSKGIDVLLNAASKIKNNNIEIILKGEGPEKSYYTRIINDLNLSEIVHFEQWGLNTDSFYERIDIFILPSSEVEGFGLVILEAMMNGVLVIASETGGITDLIQNSINGFLVKPKSVDDIVFTLNKIIENGIPETIIKNGYNTVKEYDILNIKEKYISFYRDFVILK